jgi:hypothetical protein
MTGTVVYPNHPSTVLACSYRDQNIRQEQVRLNDDEVVAADRHMPKSAQGLTARHRYGQPAKDVSRRQAE